MKKLQKLSQVKAETIDVKDLKKVVGGVPSMTYTGFEGLHTDYYSGDGRFGMCPAGC